MNKLKEYNEILKKYNVNIVKEFFYILFNCIDSSIDKYETLSEFLEHSYNYKKAKEDYKDFYCYVINYLSSLDVSKEMYLHMQAISLTDTLLEVDRNYIRDNIDIIISNIIDLIFFKYKLNINNFETNEEIKEYLMTQIEDEDIVNFLNLLLLCNTSLETGYVKKVPEEDLEHVLRMIILVSLYICNKDNDERDCKTDS
jgi:hypothetical protein